MRVTKLVKEYVEEEVALAIPNPEKPENPLEEEFENLCDNIRKESIEKMCEFFEANAGKIKLSFCDDDITTIKKRIGERSFFFNGSVSYKVIEDYHKLCKEKAKERAEAVKNILITLELGGTKAELEEMISKLKA
jgi:hypothetical protein